MVELQLEIHSKKVTGISKLKDNLRAEIEGLDVIDHIKRYDLLTRLDSTPKHVKLCHGNFGPENIVVTDDNKVYIVDWIGASSGNASADVAKTYLKLHLHLQKQLRSISTCSARRQIQQRHMFRNGFPLWRHQRSQRVLQARRRRIFSLHGLTLWTILDDSLITIMTPRFCGAFQFVEKVFCLMCFCNIIQLRPR